MLGLQQSSVWGWSSAATWGCIVVGLALLVVFVLVELRTPEPLLRAARSSATAASRSTTLMLGLISIVFVPFFFFASVYAQVVARRDASNAGLYILYFFLGFVIAAQIGGRILDTARRPAAGRLGGALAAVGFYLLAGQAAPTCRSAPSGCTWCWPAPGSA